MAQYNIAIKGLINTVRRYFQGLLVSAQSNLFFANILDYASKLL